DRITDTKGNVYVYSDNRLIELRDNAGMVMATVDYQTVDEELTVSMESVSDSTAAIYTYDGDYRKLSVDVFDSSGREIKNETYIYTKRDDGTVETVTVDRVFFESGSDVTVKRIEKYDENERLIEIFTHSVDPGSRNFVARWIAEEYGDDDKLVRSREIRCDSSTLTFQDYTEDQLNGYLDLFAGRQFLDTDLHDDVIKDFGSGNVLISDETREAEYYEDGNIKNTTKNKETFKYAPITNVVNWPETTHQCSEGSNGSYGYDGDWDTPHEGGRTGWGNGSPSICSTHYFSENLNIDIDEIRFYIYAYCHTGDSHYGGDTNASYEVEYLPEGGTWTDIPGASDSDPKHQINTTSVVNSGVLSLSGLGLENVIGIRAFASGHGSHAGNDGDKTTNIYLRIYEIQAINPETDYYSLVQLSDTTTEFTAEGYDDKNNVTGYSETKTEHLWHADANGFQIDEGALITTTDWHDATYDVDRADSFIQTVHRTDSADGLDITETTERSNLQYEKGDLVGYNEIFLTTAAPALTVERQVSGMTYANGNVSGFTEITHEWGDGLDKTTTVQKHDMLYDSWGNLAQWIDDITTPTGEYDVTDELFMYAPFESTKTTSNAVYDENGRIKTFTSVETGFVGVEAGEPREWQKKTTERTETEYNSLNQVTGSTDIVTVELEDGTIKEGPETIQKTDIVYNKQGQEYSSTSIVDGETSRVGSSTYNNLGQLVETYTRIDAYSYSQAYYYYDRAGNVTQTRNHYYYHREWSEEQGKDTVSYTQHYEKTTIRDKYGETVSEDTNEYFHVDIKKSFWSGETWRWIKQAASIVLSCIPIAPGLGMLLSFAFNTIMSIAEGTFSWISLAVQVVSMVVKVGLRAVMDAVLSGADSLTTGFDSFIKSVKGVLDAPEKTGWTAFADNLAAAAVSTAVSEGIYEVGRQNNWDTFITSAVATFASTAVGYGMSDGKGVDAIDYAFAAVEAVATGAIDKYVEDNPSELARLLAPIAKTMIGEISSLPRLMREGEAKRAKAMSTDGSTVAYYSNLQAKEGDGGQNYSAGLGSHGKLGSEEQFMPSADIEAFISEFLSLLTAKEAKRDAFLNRVWSLVSGANKAKTESKDAGYGQKNEGPSFKPDLRITGVVHVSALEGPVSETAKRSGAEYVTVLYDVKTGMEYYRFDLIKDISPVMQKLATKHGHATYKKNLYLENNNSLEIVMSKDGQKAYLLGDAMFGELKGSAKNWAVMAGYGMDDKVEFEFNLKTGDLFMFMDVKNVETLFSAENVANNEQIANLEKSISDGVAPVQNLGKIELVVRINERGAKTGEIVKATFTIDMNDITNQALSGRVKDYMSTNFPGLHGGLVYVVLSVEPQKSSDINIEGLEIKLDKNSVAETINSLKENTPKMRKLGRNLEEFVSLINNKIEAFEKIFLRVDDKGNHLIGAKLRSSVLKTMPNLMAKLRIVEGSASYNRLGRREWSYFTIDVESGMYMLDLSLRCKDFETVINEVGNTIPEKDAQGRPVKEEIYSKLGDIITTREYSYGAGVGFAGELSVIPSERSEPRNLFSILSRLKGAQNAVLTETFYATLPDGTTKELHRRSEGIMMQGVFMPDMDSPAVFEDLTGFEGATFPYIVGDFVIPFSINENLDITGEIPAAQLGLSYVVGAGSAGEPADNAGSDVIPAKAGISPAVIPSEVEGSAGQSSFKEVIYAVDKGIIEVMTSAHGILADKQILSMLADNAVRMMPGMAGVDISTREGLYQAVLAVSIASGCLVGGAHTAAGFARLVPALYNLIKGVASRSDLNLIQKTCGIAKPVLEAFSDHIESVMERALGAWYTKDAVKMLREAGHLIGECMGGLYVGSKVMQLIGGAGSFVRIKAGGMINGPVGRFMEMAGKTANRARSAASKTAERILGKEISRGLGRWLEAIRGKTGQVANKIRSVFERRMGQALKKSDRTAIGAASQGNTRFGKGVRGAGEVSQARYAGGQARYAGGQAIRKGLYILEKTFEFFKKRIRGAYISKQGAEALSDIGDKAGSITRGAGKANRARQEAWSGAGLRLRRLVDGVIPPASGTAAGVFAASVANGIFRAIERNKANTSDSSLVIPSEVEGSFQITGDLPLAAMGLSVDFFPGTARSDFPETKFLSYDAYSIGVKLDGTRLLVNGDKAFHINGTETKGAMFSAIGTANDPSVIPSEAVKSRAEGSTFSNETL
ncbi:MAG: hypothetical protein WBD04_05775, partial [Candidatus Omnitrophota bacterium]